MKSKSILIVGLALLVMCAAFVVGWFAGSRSQHRRLVAFQLQVDLLLYRAVERGDLETLRQQLATVLVARTHTYASLFPDAASSKTFADAQILTREIEAHAEPTVEATVRPRSK